MFGLLVKSLEMRQTAQRIAIYDKQEDRAGIIKELIGFLRMVIFFDNVYLMDPEVRIATTGTTKLDDSGLSFLDEWLDGDLDAPGTTSESTTKETPVAYNFKPYKAVMSLAARFANFFSVQSLTFQCA